MEMGGRFHSPRCSAARPELRLRQGTTSSSPVFLSQSKVASHSEAASLSWTLSYNSQSLQILLLVCRNCGRLPPSMCLHRVFSSRTAQWSPASDGPSPPRVNYWTDGTQSRARGPLAWRDLRDAALHVSNADEEQAGSPPTAGQRGRSPGLRRQWTGGRRLKGHQITLRSHW